MLLLDSSRLTKSLRVCFDHFAKTFLEHNDDLVFFSLLFSAAVNRNHIVLHNLVLLFPFTSVACATVLFTYSV